MKQIIFIILLVTFGFTSLKAQWSILENDTTKKVPWYLLQKFTPEEWKASNYAAEKDMEWFKEARFGMFLMPGLSAYIGEDLSFTMCYTHKAPDFGHGHIPDSIWTKYPQKLEFKKFDARHNVELAKKAGMKYIIVNGKHCDGFHMWDTKYSDFKITNTPFGRDFVKEIADACHEAGMKFGIYYTQRDWYHPDYSPVDTSLIDQIAVPPFYKAKPGVKKVIPGPNHQKFIDYQFKVIRELCTNYGKIDIFWFDACWWGGMFTADMWDSEKLTRTIRELQPGIIINNRLSLPGDYDTPEQIIGMYQERPWESCITLNGTWSWSDNPPKSIQLLVKSLTATACGNGNLLLSWGPRWDGSFDPSQEKRMIEMGDWLKTYGHTIYNTHGGPWYPGNWGGSTYRGSKAFIHITGKVGKRLKLEPVENKIIKARSLTGGEVQFSQNEENVIINLEKVSADTVSTIIELTFKKDVNGMVKKKTSLAKFSDPIYGQVISSDATLKLSSVAASDTGQDYSRLFTESANTNEYSFCTRDEENPYALIDLGKSYSVTGVDLYNQKKYPSQPGSFVIETSVDGENWRLAEKKDKSFSHWEATVAQFNAGIQLPGVPARYVRITLQSVGKTPLHLKKVFVYGN